MQFRLLASSTATNLNRILFSSPPNITTNIPSLSPALINFTTSSTGRTADPGLYSHSERTDQQAASSKETEQKPTKENDVFVSPTKTPPSVSSPKLESTGVNKPIQPITQQKRHNSSTAANVSPIEGVCCAGLDGSPWPEEVNDGDRKEQEEEDEECFSHRKASPLSEIEVADSRKPYQVGGSDGLILFREEQLDTAEDALRRAVEMWRESAARGDPDSPHGRILRALRGEWW